MKQQTEQKLSFARDSLKKADTATAIATLEDALSFDLQNEEIVSTISFASYWNTHLKRIMGADSPFERGEAIILQWKDFSEKYGDTPWKRSLDAVRQGVFQLALEQYKAVFQESGGSQRAEILRKAGLCYKKLGDYDTALTFLNEANSLVGECAPVLAEMADCYALCGNERIAKVLFREAFFVDAEKVDISLLESELITTLVSYVEKAGYSGAQLNEWVPVYGVLYGVFNIKRELRAVEAGKLKQTVFSLENELKDERRDATLIKPRLINHYFWLVDHYVNTNDERSKINEILLKIKLLDPAVHEKYVV